MKERERYRELGTLQGGVLSPTFSNTLMKILAQYEFQEDMKVVRDAEDVLLRLKGLNNMQDALQTLSTL